MQTTSYTQSASAAPIPIVKLPIQFPAENSNPWTDPVVGAMYNEFAAQPWYRENNEALLQMVGALPEGACVDLGSGTGSGTELLAARTRSAQMIYGLDTSEALVKYAGAQVAAGTNAEKIRFLVGAAERFPELVSSPIGSVFAFNAIHLFPDLEALIKRSAETLPGGGIFAFNTAFSKEALDKQNRGPWIHLVRELRERAAETSAQIGESPEYKTRCKTLSSAEFVELFQACGFARVRAELREVAIPASSLRSFLQIPGLTQEILPAALAPRERRNLIDRALENLQFDSLTRRWLMVSAER